MIYIRADANNEIGTGHIMRCLSIAAKLKKLGEDTTFIVADEQSKKLVVEKGYKAICMQTVWNDLDSELSKLTEIIVSNQIKTLLIDDYYVTEKYLIKINSLTHVIYLDDLNKFEYPVDFLINYNIYAKDLDYSERYKKKKLSTKFLLGTKYAPLRSEFENCEGRKYKGIKKILITSGGTDNYNMIDNILERFMQTESFNNQEYYCIIGRFNINKDELQKKYSGYGNIHLLYNISNISEYMKTCDICITAGGTTIYELCDCGIPAIVYTIADNQLDCARKISDMKLIPWVGDVRNNLSQCLDNIVTECERMKSKNYWEETSRRMMELVDGRGAEKIAEKLLEIN